MSIIFGVVSTIIGLAVFYFLGLQFYKLGQTIKEKYPIIYRIYVILWSLILAVIVFFILAMIDGKVESRKHEKRMSELSTIIESKPYIDKTNKHAMVSELRAKGYTDYEIYTSLKESPQLKESFEKAKQEGGFSDSQIAKDVFGLDIYKKAPN